MAVPAWVWPAGLSAPNRPRASVPSSWAEEESDSRRGQRWRRSWSTRDRPAWTWKGHERYPQWWSRCASCGSATPPPPPPAGQIRIMRDMGTLWHLSLRFRKPAASPCRGGHLHHSLGCKASSWCGWDPREVRPAERPTARESPAADNPKTEERSDPPESTHTHTRRKGW